MLNVKPYDWENVLISLAYEAKRSHKIEGNRLTYDNTLLQQAYNHCELITKIHSKSFSMASRLLPYEKRRAVQALYAFCRTIDDLVDHPNGNVEAELDEWRKRSVSRRPSGNNHTAVAWADARTRYQIPKRYAEQLIEGVARDLYQSRYQTFDELANYCYGVASTVGLMSMHIIGFTGPEAIPYAIKLGVALQITNILRDVAEDWRAGRHPT